MEITSAAQLLTETKKRFENGTYAWGQVTYFEPLTGCLCFSGGIMVTMFGTKTIIDHDEWGRCYNGYNTSLMKGTKEGTILNDAWFAIVDANPQHQNIVALNDSARDVRELFPIIDKAVEALRMSS